MRHDAQSGYDVAELAHWDGGALEARLRARRARDRCLARRRQGRDELGKIAAISGEPRPRHPGCTGSFGTSTPLRVLEEAGYDYDASLGYNETIGYLNGTTQVFRPSGVRSLLELPLHIQDGALFFPNRLDLSESDAWTRCEELIGRAGPLGGVLTVVWHDRSHGPERFWGDFYLRLLRTLRELDGWFGTSGQVVGWFRKRPPDPLRAARRRHGTAQIRLRYDGRADRPAGDSPGARAGLDVRRCALEWQRPPSISIGRRARRSVRRISPAMKSVCMLLQNPYDGDVRVRRKAEALVAAGYSVDVLALRASAGKRTYSLNGVTVRTVGLARSGDPWRGTCSNTSRSSSGRASRSRS